MTRTRRPAPPCAPTPPGHRFRPADHVVLVIVLVLASALSLAGVPAPSVLHVPAGAGFVALHLLRREAAVLPQGPRGARTRR
jgi:hypothetical protein